jgi:hypothetical protein
MRIVSEARPFKQMHTDKTLAAIPAKRNWTDVWDRCEQRRFDAVFSLANERSKRRSYTSREIGFLML